jgi:hypothetical protein
MSRTPIIPIVLTAALLSVALAMNVLVAPVH